MKEEFEDLHSESEAKKKAMKEEFEKTNKTLNDKFEISEHNFENLQDAYNDLMKELEKHSNLIEKLGEFYTSLDAKTQKLEEANGIPKRPKRVWVPLTDLYDERGNEKIILAESEKDPLTRAENLQKRWDNLLEKSKTNQTKDLEKSKP